MILIKNKQQHPYPSIGRKFVFTLCSTVIIPAIVLCFYMIYQHYQATATVQQNNRASYLQDVRNTLDAHLSFTGNIVTAIEDCPDIRIKLKDLKNNSASDKFEPLNIKEAINSPIIYKQFFAQPAVNAVTLFYEDQLIYYALDNTSLDLSLERCFELYQNCQSLTLSNGQFIPPSNGSAYAYWVQDYRNIYENHYYGKIVIELNPVPNNILDNINAGQSRYTYALDLNQYPGVQYWLYTDQSAVIFSSNTQDAGSLVYNCLPSDLHADAQDLPMDSTAYFIHGETLNDHNLQLYLIMPKKPILLQQNMLLYILVSILLCIIYIFAATLGGRALIRPLQQLHDYYDLTQEQPLIKPIFQPDCKEISETRELIENRIEEIQLLNKECETLQNQLKDYEIKNLQAQINPHFLFNMLDAIHWKASNTGSADVSNMVIQLSEMLHSNILFNGKQKITIRQELEYIQNYLMLQQISMAVNFQYKINADDEILDIYQIPKLCLQPIVENSIVHGFKDIHYEGYLVISIWEETDGILCKIEDNGCGFSADDVLQNKPTFNGLTFESQHHIALKNIADRLLILYGAKYGIDIQSSPGNGTIVMVHVPFDRIKEHTNS